MIWKIMRYFTSVVTGKNKNEMKMHSNIKSSKLFVSLDLRSKYLLDKNMGKARLPWKY